VIGAVITALLWPLRYRFESLIQADILGTLLIIRSLSLNMMATVVAILFLVAAADYLFQYRQWFARQKMSLREMKDEYKQTEGDPLVKGKIRQLRQARQRRRMMAAVPKASVIITNPTHYAIALQYDRGMEAPICLAKGADAVALKIREVAGEHSIPIVENPPLARALYATVEIDEEIPTEHYKAVAEIIGYVMKLRRGAGRAPP
jgi:flagellar biosynthetic protein FlhB